MSLNACLKCRFFQSSGLTIRIGLSEKSEGNGSNRRLMDAVILNMMTIALLFKSHVQIVQIEKSQTDIASQNKRSAILANAFTILSQCMSNRLESLKPSRQSFSIHSSPLINLNLFSCTIFNNVSLPHIHATHLLNHC